MRRLRGDDPLVTGVVLARVDFVLAGTTVPGHVPGVLWVAEDFPYRGAGPAADCAFGVDGRWRRVAVQVLVEPVGDCPVAELLVDSPCEHLLYDRSAYRVDDELGLLPSLGAPGGHGVLVLVGEVSDRKSVV